MHFFENFYNFFQKSSKKAQIFIYFQEFLDQKYLSIDYLLNIS